MMKKVMMKKHTRKDAVFFLTVHLILLLLPFADLIGFPTMMQTLNPTTTTCQLLSSTQVFI